MAERRVAERRAADDRLGAMPRSSPATTLSAPAWLDHRAATRSTSGSTARVDHASTPAASSTRRRAASRHRLPTSRSASARRRARGRRSGRSVPGMRPPSAVAVGPGRRRSRRWRLATRASPEQTRPRVQRTSARTLGSIGAVATLCRPLGSPTGRCRRQRRSPVVDRVGASRRGRMVARRARGHAERRAPDRRGRQRRSGSASAARRPAAMPSPVT